MVSSLFTCAELLCGFHDDADQRSRFSVRFFPNSVGSPQKALADVLPLPPPLSGLRSGMPVDLRS